jgi:multidrug efflux pump subunit AcrA (membrane-fusion protein)
VYPGQQVDITVDAYPDSTLTGYVREINPGSRMAKPPESSETRPGGPGEDHLAAPKKLTLVPGMNVTVRIHQN